jgi:Putative transmembrane protein (PGPGW)
MGSPRRAGKTFDQNHPFLSKGPHMSSGLHSPMQWLRWIGRNTKRLAVFVLGATVLGAGLAMLALPGPGLLVIILGLAILASEFAWAERALDRTTATAAPAATKVSGNTSGRIALALSGMGMVVGGAVVAAFEDDFRVVGGTVALAGLIALCTLLPQVQRWLEAKSAPRSAPTPAE